MNFIKRLQKKHYWTGEGRRHAYMPKLITDHNTFVAQLKSNDGR